MKWWKQTQRAELLEAFLGAYPDFELLMSSQKVRWSKSGKLFSTSHVEHLYAFVQGRFYISWTDTSQVQSVDVDVVEHPRLVSVDVPEDVADDIVQIAQGLHIQRSLNMCLTRPAPSLGAVLHRCRHVIPEFKAREWCVLAKKVNTLKHIPPSATSTSSAAPSASGRLPMELVRLRGSSRHRDDDCNLMHRNTADLDSDATSACSLDLLPTKVVEIGPPCRVPVGARSWFEALYESQLDEECAQPLPGEVLEFWQERGYHATMRDGVIVLAPCTPLVPSAQDFEMAPSFQGVRSGWCFKMGHHGLGYYRDLKKQVVLELEDVISLHRDCEVDHTSSHSSSYHYPMSEDDGEEFLRERAQEYGKEFLDRKEREYRELERQELLREVGAFDLLGPPPPLPPLPMLAECDDARQQHLSMD